MNVHTVKDSGAALYRAGDDKEEFFQGVTLMANAKHQSAHRKQESK